MLKKTLLAAAALSFMAVGAASPALADYNHGNNYKKYKNYNNYNNHYSYKKNNNYKQYSYKKHHNFRPYPWWLQYGWNYGRQW